MQNSTKIIIALLCTIAMSVALIAGVLSVGFYRDAAERSRARQNIVDIQKRNEWNAAVLQRLIDMEVQGKSPAEIDQYKAANLDKPPVSFKLASDPSS
jgi:hypothetical protein